jgi:phosphoribosylglycinamide formyltransferase 2
VRAILGYPITSVELFTAGATRTLKAERESDSFTISGVADALEHPRTQVRLFGKPVTKPGRRMAVVLTAADSVEQARNIATTAQQQLQIQYHD